MTSCSQVLDCLKSYDKYREVNLMMRLGPTLTGSKPMHIFCFNQNFKFMKEIMNDIKVLFSQSKNIKYRKVFSENKSIKVIFYNEETCKKMLEDKRNKRFLISQGYDEIFVVEDYMDILAEKLVSNTIPGEFGLFFGYPLKDVMGFMGHPSLKHIKTTAWKVYGDPTLSDKIYNRFKESEKQVLELCKTLSLQNAIQHLETVY